MEVSTLEAGAIIGLGDEAIRQHIKNGRLVARQVGLRGVYRIALSHLYNLSQRYNYEWNTDKIPEHIH